jgi:hypothetical protein
MITWKVDPFWALEEFGGLTFLEIRLFWGVCSFGIRLTWSKYMIG